MESDYLKACFAETLVRFPELAGHTIRFERVALPGYTMRAQPVFNRYIFRRRPRHYRVQLSNHGKISRYVRPRELPREVVVGWFAHELGHIVDYHRRSLAGLLWFVIGYILFPTHRAGAERRADLFAIDRGFGDELMATKLYILEQSSLPDRYKRRIEKYYMSPDELELLLQDKEAERVLF